MFMLVFVFNVKFMFSYVVDEYIRDFDHWMTYKSVEPAKQIFAGDEIIEMISSRTVFKDVKTTWIDVLYCKRNGDENYKRFSQSATGGTIMRVSSYRENRWLYAGRQPTEHSMCFMVSDIILSPSLLIEKVQTKKSGIFEIENDIDKLRNNFSKGG